MFFNAKNNNLTTTSRINEIKQQEQQQQQYKSIKISELKELFSFNREIRSFQFKRKDFAIKREISRSHEVIFPFVFLCFF